MIQPEGKFLSSVNCETKDVTCFQNTMVDRHRRDSPTPKGRTQKGRDDGAQASLKPSKGNTKAQE